MSKRTIEDVLGAIKVPVRSVSICMNGDLQAEWDELTTRLEVLNRETNGKMSGRTEALEAADRITEIESEMRESEVIFKFRGLSKGARKAIEERFPAPDPNPDNLRWNVDAGAFALLAASAVEPTMTEGQAKQLLERLSEGQADRLFGAAWLASTGSTQVPFSERASELTSGTGSN